MSAAVRLDPEPLSPAWFEARRAGVTASEIAVVLGIAPPSWSSPLALYLRKRGEIGETPDNEAMRWGRALESVILDRFAELHPELHVTRGALYRHADRPYQMATPDGLAWEGFAEIELSATVQAKTAGSTDHFGDEGTDEIPAYYRAQVLWEMDTLGVPVAFVPVLFHGRNYREYVVEYDGDECLFMRERAVDFLARIRDGDPPDVDWSPATTDALRARYPSVTDTEVELPAELVAKWREAADSEDEAHKQRKHVENAIRLLMGEATTAVADGEKAASRSIYDRTSVDSKRLRKERPDVFDTYKRVSTVDRLTISRKG